MMMMMMMTFITRRGEGQGKTKKERKATKSKGRGLEEGASRALMRQSWRGNLHQQSKTLAHTQIYQQPRSLAAHGTCSWFTVIEKGRQVTKSGGYDRAIHWLCPPLATRREGGF